MPPYPQIDPVAVALGPLKIHWYGLMYLIGIGGAWLLASRRLIKRVNPDDPDINDRSARLVGARAEVVQPFVDGRGRVFVSGSEWPADIEGEAPPVGASVIVAGVDGPRLKVKP